jgi:hypothetical protein
MHTAISFMLTTVQTLRHGRRPSFTIIAGRERLTSGFVANSVLSTDAVVSGSSVGVAHDERDSV